MWVLFEGGVVEIDQDIIMGIFGIFIDRVIIFVICMFRKPYNRVELDIQCHSFL